MDPPPQEIRRFIRDPFDPNIKDVPRNNNNNDIGKRTSSENAEKHLPGKRISLFQEYLAFFAVGIFIFIFRIFN